MINLTDQYAGTHGTPQGTVCFSLWLAQAHKKTFDLPDYQASPKEISVLVVIRTPVRKVCKFTQQFSAAAISIWASCGSVPFAALRET